MGLREFPYLWGKEKNTIPSAPPAPPLSCLTQRGLYTEAASLEILINAFFPSPNLNSFLNDLQTLTRSYPSHPSNSEPLGIIIQTWFSVPAIALFFIPVPLNLAPSSNVPLYSDPPLPLCFIPIQVLPETSLS